MTKQEKVAAWLRALDFRWSQGGYWMHDKYGALAPDQATFFYDVVLEAQLDLLSKLEAESYLEQEPKGQNALRAQVVRVATLNNIKRHLKQKGTS